jgi:hypothetical protein
MSEPDPPRADVSAGPGSGGRFVPFDLEARVSWELILWERCGIPVDSSWRWRRIWRTLEQAQEARDRSRAAHAGVGEAIVLVIEGPVL